MCYNDDEIVANIVQIAVIDLTATARQAFRKNLTRTNMNINVEGKHLYLPPPAQED